MKIIGSSSSELYYLIDIFQMKPNVYLMPKKYTYFNIQSEGQELSLTFIYLFSNLHTTAINYFFLTFTFFITK